MTEMKLCEYCLENLKPIDDHVILQKESGEKPEKWAHPDCHRKFLKDREEDG